MITDKNFLDWHNHVLGCGYGSGEQYWIPALHTLMTELMPTTGFESVQSKTYDHEKIETKLGSLAAWLFINILCDARIIEYGTSPRYGWLSYKGRLLQEYVAAHSVCQLMDTIESGAGMGSLYTPCCPGGCNCTLLVATVDGVTVRCNPLF